LKELTSDDYDVDNDCLLNYTSLYLPLHRDFNNFWNNMIIIHNSNSQSNLLAGEFIFNIYELEIDELCMLFRAWHKQSEEQLLSNGNINEDNIIKILKHFYPDIKIVNDKYILLFLVYTFE
jgi:hypothetical protein